MHHLSLEDEVRWLREAVLQALNSSVSSRESVRDQKEFHRGHAKPLRGASKDSPQEAVAHGEEAGPHLTLSEEPPSPVFHEAKSQAALSPLDQRRGKAAVCFMEPQPPRPCQFPLLKET